MASATLQITVIPKRMLNKSEGAHHCGRSVKRFEIECPMLPIRFPNGDVRYDIQDLDAWLNTLKSGGGEQDNDALIERLG